jgi:hypothetical protein
MPVFAAFYSFVPHKILRRGVLMAHVADWRRRGSDFPKAPGGGGALARARAATR